MASSQSQRLRRSSEKAARRKVIVAEKRRADTLGLTGSEAREIDMASHAPVKTCLVAEQLFELGMGWVVMARSLPSGLIAASFFLVDAWCLGVKDTMFAAMPGITFQDRIDEVSEHQPLVAIDPPVARKLLHDAAAFAASLGLRPDEGFARTESIFGAIPMAEDTFSFGRDGKPFFAPGPNDSPTRVRCVMDTLTKHLSPKNYGIIGLAEDLE